MLKYEPPLDDEQGADDGADASCPHCGHEHEVTAVTWAHWQCPACGKWVDVAEEEVPSWQH